MNTANFVWTPGDVFYVVRSTGLPGNQQHRVSSVLYETRPQAEAELARLRAGWPATHYSVWRGTSYVEPHLWMYPVVLADGVVVSPGGRAVTSRPGVNKR